MRRNNSLRDKRKKRIRAKVFGTGHRPRLSVFRSNKNLFAQIINDEIGQTLVAGRSVALGNENKTKAAKALGLEIARRAREKGIGPVVFDRGGYLYHGRVAALAEGAREGGLSF